MVKVVRMMWMMRMVQMVQMVRVVRVVWMVQMVQMTRLHDVDGGVPRRGGARVRSRMEERVVLAGERR